MLANGDKLIVTKKVAPFLNEGDVVKVTNVTDDGIISFAFGDGFSNVLYPTNPVLLISLGLADVSYGKWFRWSWKFQALNLLLTSALLLFGLWIGY